MQKVKILIDAGHGIETPGKRSPDGLLREYAWARDCAKELYTWLKGENSFEPILLQDDDSDMPLPVRVKKANSFPKSSVLVSLHCNAYGSGKEWTSPKGWSIWTSIGKTKSDDIATSIWEQAKVKWGSARQDRSDGDPDFENSFYILKNTKCAAVLIENFFMTNKEDCQYLLSPMSIYDCAEVVVKGLKEYYHV